MNPQILITITGISTFLGLAGLLVYVYFLLAQRKAERSIQALVEGEKLINSTQVLEILGKFSDDASRLKALEQLTNHDSRKASRLLSKIKGGVDVNELNQGWLESHMQLMAIAAVLFFGIAILSYMYSSPSQPDKATKTEPPEDVPTKTEPVKTEPVKTEPEKTEPVKTQLTLRCQLSSRRDAHEQEVFLSFAKHVRDRAPHLMLEVLPSGAVGDPSEIPDAVATGTLQCGSVSGAIAERLRRNPRPEIFVSGGGGDVMIIFNRKSYENLDPAAKAAIS